MHDLLGNSPIGLVEDKISSNNVLEIKTVD